MSEVLRDLVVSLSLDSDNFSRNMRTINQQIKEAESTFKLAGAGVDGFEKTIDGAKAKLTMLNSTLEMQNRAVEQYSRALVAANAKLEASGAKQDKLKASLVSARAEHERLGAQVAAAGAKYREYADALGESDSVTIMAKENLDQLKAEHEAAAAEVKKLEGQLTANTKTLQNNADAISKAQTNLNAAKADVKATEAQIKALSDRLIAMQSGWTKTGDALTAFSKKADALGKTLTTAGKNLTQYVTTPILALGTAAVTASVSFESAFASVRKTVDATEAEYETLSNSVKRMSTEVATASEDIAEVMANAGQLGIQNDYLVEFTRTMIDLGNSTDIAANEAATAIAQFANVTNMAQTEFSSFGSALVELGNNFATTESAVLSMATRMASAGSQVGFSQSQILGFATALSSVGLEAEAGGTAFSKALIQMQVAVETGNDSLADFARVAGMTSKEFSEMWREDAAGAFQAFLVGLSKMSEEGVSAIATLEDIGISEVRLRDTLLRATNATELFTRAQDMAAAAWAENTALADEASKRYATTESKLTNLKNTAILFAQRIGDDLNPTVQSMIDGANDLLEKFMALDEGQRLMIVKMAAIAAATGPALLVLGKVSKGVSSVTAMLGKFSTAVGAAGGGWQGFIAVAGKSPVVWLAVAAAVVVAAKALHDYATGAKEARDALEGMDKVAGEWANRTASTVYDNGGLADFGLSKEDFTGAARSATEWKNGLIKVWTDGKAETNAIVSEWTDSFKALNAGMKESLEQLRKDATATGHTEIADSIQKDIDALAAMDAEVEKLLKKRQNGLLSEKDKLRLDQLIDAREAIQVKYNLVPDVGGGYEAILQQIEIEKARAQARGESTVDTSVYESGLKAAAEGYSAVAKAADERYDAEYKVVQLVEDEAKRSKAQADLDAQYNAERAAAAQEYAETLRQVLLPTWENDGIQQASADMDTLLQKFRDYSALGGSGYQDPALLTEMEKLTEGMNQDDILSYIGMLQQVQSLLDGGMTESEVQAVFPELDFSKNLDELAALADFAAQRSGELEGLSKILSEVIPEQMQTISIDLNMDKAKERWAEFSENPGAITTSAVIASYDDTSAVKPIPSVVVSITGYDLAAYNDFVANNPVEVTGIVRLGEKYADPASVLDDPNAKFYMNGRQIAVDIVPREKITDKTLMMYDEDGTLHVLITPDIQGTGESAQAASDALSSTEHQGSLGAKWFGDDTLADLMRLNDYLAGIQNEMNSFLNIGGWMDGWNREAANATISNYLDPTEIGNIQAAVTEAIAALNNGETLSEDVIANLQQIQHLVELMDAIGVGENVIAGIAEGMTEAGIDTDAETVATNLETAINKALGIESPSTRMRPAGMQAAAGIGVGMTLFPLAGYAAAVGASLLSALQTAISVGTTKPIGKNASLGIAAGILSGQAAVVSAIRTVARAAVVAAKKELRIESPSGVFREEVGRMAIQGVGVGAIEESKTQARVMRNAARYLADSAQAGVAASASSSDNRKSYYYNSSAAVHVDKLYVNDKQDVVALAVEVASLTRRRQRGKGARSA